MVGGSMIGGHAALKRYALPYVEMLGWEAEGVKTRNKVLHGGVSNA